MGRDSEQSGERAAGSSHQDCGCRDAASVRRSRNSLPPISAGLHSRPAANALGDDQAQSWKRITGTGCPAEGSEAERLLGEAVAAYLEALQVWTREQRPQQWAMAQNNLARAYLNLKDWTKAAKCYEQVLRTLFHGRQFRRMSATHFGLVVR